MPRCSNFPALLPTSVLSLLALSRQVLATHVRMLPRDEATPPSGVPQLAIPESMVPHPAPSRKNDSAFSGKNRQKTRLRGLGPVKAIADRAAAPGLPPRRATRRGTGCVWDNQAGYSGTMRPEMGRKGPFASPRDGSGPYALIGFEAKMDH